MKCRAFCVAFSLCVGLQIAGFHDYPLWFHTTLPNTAEWAEQQISTSLSHVKKRKKKKKRQEKLRMQRAVSFKWEVRFSSLSQYQMEEPKQSVFFLLGRVRASLLEMAEKSLFVFRSRLLPRFFQLTLTWKRNPDWIKTFLNMQTYFTFLQGWMRQSPSGNLEKLDKCAWL